MTSTCRPRSPARPEPRCAGRGAAGRTARRPRERVSARRRCRHRSPGPSRRPGQAVEGDQGHLQCLDLAEIKVERTGSSSSAACSARAAAGACGRPPRQRRGGEAPQAGRQPAMVTRGEQPVRRAVAEDRKRNKGQGGERRVGERQLVAAGGAWAAGRTDRRRAAPPWRRCGRHPDQGGSRPGRRRGRDERNRSPRRPGSPSPAGRIVAGARGSPPAVCSPARCWPGNG